MARKDAGDNLSLQMVKPMALPEPLHNLPAMRGTGGLDQFKPPGKIASCFCPGRENKLELHICRSNRHFFQRHSPRINPINVKYTVIYPPLIKM